MKKFILVSLGLLLAFSSFSKSSSTTDSYNMRRAQEEVKYGNYGSAIEFFNQELEENPKNAFAYLGIATVNIDRQDYSEAFKAINKGMKLLPKKEKQMLAFSHQLRGNVYLATGDTVNGLADLNEAIKLCPYNEDLYKNRGQLYYELEKYPEADADYLAMMKLNPGNVIAYMGLGRNANEREEYDEALKYYTRAINIRDDYATAYIYRSDTYRNLKKYVEAADDLMEALNLGDDELAFYALFEFPAEQTPLLISKLRAQAVQEPDEAVWPYFMANVYMDKEMYKEAIECLDKAYELDEYTPFLLMKTSCFESLGDYDKAYDTILEAEKRLPYDSDVIALKADVLGEGGNIEGALEEWSRYIDDNPDEYIGYYRRGFFEDNYGMTDKALEDYNMTVMLNPEYAYGWMGKGDMHERKGEKEKAVEAYEMTVKLDTVPDNTSCAMYALLALGRTDEAIRFMEAMIEKDPSDAGNYYDGACFYSRTGDLDKSLACLRTSLEKGFRRYHHIMVDDDLEALRKTEGFKKLLEEYGISNPDEIPVLQIKEAEDTIDISKSSPWI